MVFPRATLAGVACLLVLLAVLVPGRADAQTRLDEYIVTGVEVDVTAQTAAAARDRAFLDAVRAGMFTVPGDGMIDYDPVFDQGVLIGPPRR